jgi:7-carboxy-7-deazaguanine synthase
MAIENQITEQFLTVQGEGRSVGRLAYFLRLAGCNLWCRWCDSLHSVDPALFKGKTFPIDYTQIPSNCPLVVITGGEPTLFDLARIREELLKGNPEREIEVESNATRFPEALVDRFRWNLSPKLKSSGQKHPEQDQKRLVALPAWAEYARKSKLNNVIFKFVVTNETDMHEVLALVESHQIPRSLVYLMAEGQKPESQTLSAIQPVLEFAKAHGFNFSPRLHIMFWGEKRGV